MIPLTRKKEADSAQDHLDKAQDNLDSTESIIDDVKAKNDLDGTDTDDKDLSKVKAQLDKAADSVSKQAESAEKLAKSAEKAAEKARESGDKADLSKAEAKLAEAKDALKKATESKAQLDELISKAGAKGVDTKDAQADADAAQQHLNGAGSALTNAGKIISDLQNKSDIDKDLDDTGKAIDDLDDKSTAKEKAEAKEKLDNTAKNVDKLAEDAQWLAEKAKEAAEIARNTGNKKDIADAQAKQDKAQDALKKAEEAKSKLDDLITKAKGKGVDTSDAEKESDSAQIHLDKAQEILDDSARIIDEAKAKNDLNDTDTDVGKLPDNPTPQDLAKVKAQLDKAAGSVLQQAENAKELAKTAQMEAERASDTGYKSDLVYAQAKLAEATETLKRATDSKAKLDDLISKAGAKGVDTKDALKDAHLAQELLNDARDALTDAEQVLSDLMKDIDNTIDDTNTAIDDLPDNPTDEQKADVKERLDFTAKLVDNLADEAETLANAAKVAADKARKSGSKSDLENAQAKQADAKDALKKAEDAKAKLDKLISKAADKGVDTGDAAKDAGSAEKHIGNAHNTINATDKILSDLKDDNDSKDAIDHAEDDIKNLDDNATPEEKAKAKESLDAASDMVVALADSAKTLAAKAKVAAEKAQSGHDINELKAAQALLKEAQSAFDEAGAAKARLDKLITQAKGKGVDTKDASADSDTAKTYLDDAQQNLTASENILKDMPTEMTDPALDDAGKAIDDATKNPSDENKAKAKDSLNQAATLVAKQAKEAEALAKNAKEAADKAKASGSPDDIRAAEEAIKTASESIAKAEKSKAHLDELIGKAKAAGIDAAQSETLSHDAENSLTNANNVLKEAAQTLDDLSNQEGDPALIADVQTALDNLSDQIQNAQNKGVSANSKIDKLVGLTSPAEKDIQEAKAALAEFTKAIKAAESADPAVKAALDKAVKGGVGNKKLAELTEKETELLSLLNDQKKLADSLNKQIQEIESNAVLDELNNALDGLDPKKPETVNAFNKALKKAIENNNELITELTEKAQKALDSALKLAQTDPTSDAYQQLLQDVKQQISNAEELYALAKNNTTDLQRVVEKAIGKGLDPAKNAEFKEYIANIKYFENEINKAGANIAKAKNAVPDEKLPDFDGDDISNLVDHLEDQIKAGDAAGINKTLLDVDSVIYTQLNDVNKALDKAGRAFEKAQKDPTTANVKAFDKAVLDAQSVINKAELNISKLHDSLVKAGTIAGVDADSLAHALKSAEKAGTAVDEAQKTLDGFSLNPIDMEGLQDKATDAKDAVDEMVKNPTPDNIDNALSKLNIFKSALGTSLTNAKALSDDALMAAKQAVKTPTAENILRAEKKLAKAVEAQEQLIEAKAMYDDVRTHISTSVTNKALQDALLKTFDGMDNQFDHTQKNVNEQNDESGKLIAIAKDNLLTEEDIVDAYNNAKLTLTDAEAKVREAVDKAAKAKESGDISKEQTTAIKNSVIGAQDSLNKAKDAIENAGNKGVPEYLLDQLNKYYNSLDNKLDYPKGVLQEIDSYSRMSLSLELLNNATDYYKKAEALLEKDPNAVIKDPSEFLSLISEANAYLAEGKERATKAKALGLDKESETYLNTAAHTANETQTKLMNDFHGKLGEKAFADLDAELTQLQESVYNAHSSLNKSTQSNHAVFEEQYKAAIRALNDTKLLIEDYTAKGVKPVKLSYYNYQVEQYSKEIENLSKAWNSVTELTAITNTVYSESKALSGIKNSSDKYDAIQKVGEDLGKAYQLVEQSIINGAPIDMIQSNLNKLTATANNLSAEDPIVAAQVLINNVVSESKNIENLLKAADTKVQKDLIYNSLYGQLQTANKVMSDAKQSGTISKTQLAELQQDYSNALNTLKMYDPYFSNGEQTQKPNSAFDAMTLQVTDDGYIHIEGRKLVDGAVYTLGGKDLPWYSAWLGNIAGNVDKVFGSGTVHTRTDGTKYVDIFVDKETAYNVKHSDNLSYLYGFQQELGKDPSELGGGFRVKDSSAPKDMEAFITDDHTIVVTGDGLKAGDSVTLYKVTTSGILGTKNYEEVAKGHVALHNGKFVGVMTEYAKGHSWETVKNLGGDDNLAATRKGLGENQSGKSDVFGKIASPAEISSDIIGGNKTADILTKDVTAWVDTKKNLYLKSQKFEVGQLVKIHDFYDSKNVVGTGVVQMIGGQKIVKIEGVTTDKYPDLKWIYAEIAYEGGQWDYIQSDAFILGKNWLSVQGNANSNTQEPPKDNDANDGINFDDIDIDPSAPAGKPAVKSFSIQDETDGQAEEQAKETDDIRDTQEESHEIRTENDEHSVNEVQSELSATSDEINDDVDLSGLLNAGNTSAGETGDIDTTDGITGLPVLDELLTDSAESTINIDNIVPQAADTEHNVQPELFINNTADSSTETHQVSTLITEDDMGITHNI
ncbi:hypothetical protein [Morganella psychrotolerans]|uniref:hypothetical protein n=1 Tax=Morganella psychrotolerans TaxID=368603 RepID=UPI000A96DECE|nr:hypothetical protein [Morganella psychrotolerans]